MKKSYINVAPPAPISETLSDEDYAMIFLKSLLSYSFNKLVYYINLFIHFPNFYNYFFLVNYVV